LEVASHRKLYRPLPKKPFFLGVKKLKCVMAKRLPNQSV
jgi:hypothetical protein